MRHLIDYLIALLKRKCHFFLFYLISINVYFLFIVDVSSQILTQDHFLSLDTRYFYPGYSNRAVGQLGTELLQLSSLPADALVRKDSINSMEGNFLFYSKREARFMVNGLLKFVTSAIISPGFTFAYHEYGHGTRAAAVGFRPFYGHGSIRSPDDYLFAISGAVKLNDSFLPYYLASLFNTAGYTVTKPDDFLFNPRFDLLDAGWDLDLAASGINNEMLFSEYIEDDISYRGGHLGHLIPYISGKLSAQNYSISNGIFNDLGNILRIYKDQGKDISEEDVKRGSWIAALGSTMSYQLMWQMINMFRGKDSNFSPWHIGAFDLPNTSFYINQEGLSLKIKSTYYNKKWRFPFFIEHIIQGGGQTEVGLKAQRRFDKFELALGTIVSKSVELDAEVIYKPHKKFFFSAGYTLYNLNNLNGRRLIPDLQNANSFNALFLRVSYVY